MEILTVEVFHYQWRETSIFLLPTTRKDWFTGNLVRTDSSLFGCVGTGRARAGRAAASRQSDQNRHTEHTEQLSPPSSPVKSSVTSEHF